jgi:hypothetical protein
LSISCTKVDYELPPLVADNKTVYAINIMKVTKSHPKNEGFQ